MSPLTNCSLTEEPNWKIVIVHRLDKDLLKEKITSLRTNKLIKRNYKHFKMWKIPILILLTNLVLYLIINIVLYGM